MKSKPNKPKKKKTFTNVQECNNCHSHETKMHYIKKNGLITFKHHLEKKKKSKNR